MYKSARIDLRLSPREVEILDTKRGSHSRSAYIRWLIEQDKPVSTRSSLSEPIPEPEPPPIPEPITPPIPPDPPIEAVSTAKRHFHRYKKVGEPVRYEKAVKIYRQVCDCGKEIEAP
jgi:hypothetical protein